MNDMTKHETCAICGSPAEFAYRHPEADIWRCTGCTHAFTRQGTLRVQEDYGQQYYDTDHKNWFEHPDIALFNWIDRSIPASAKNLIDIGCGRGDFLRHIRRSRPDMALVGIDLSSNAPTAEFDYIQGDIMETALDQRFDAVVSLAAIEHMKAPLPFAQRLRELCAPDGKVIVMTINEASLLYRMARMARRLGVPILFNRLYSAHHLHHFSIRSLQQLLVEAGFEIESIHQHNTPLRAVDLPPSVDRFRPMALAVLAVIFALSKATSMCLSQTIVARPRATDNTSK